MPPLGPHGEKFLDSLRLFDFASEAAADAWLRPRLETYFKLIPQVRIRHLISDNILKIDYLARPLYDDFPFPWFGVELKKSLRGGDYNQALHQCLDYTHCEVIDTRTPRLLNRRIKRVYLFPGLPDGFGAPGPTPFWLNRFVGTFHVGLIYFHEYQGLTFAACADRQWSEHYGPIGRPHNIRHRVGSGVHLRVVK